MHKHVTYFLFKKHGRGEGGGGRGSGDLNQIKQPCVAVFFFCVPLDPKHFFIKQNVESSCFYISIPILEVALKNLNYNIL